METTAEKNEEIRTGTDLIDRTTGIDEKEKLAVIDFKMITFSLAGKDYAIDIMKVKEIAKAGRFTYVPNVMPFVIGVYNLSLISLLVAMCWRNAPI